MWYEILPSAFIIYAAFLFDAQATYWIHKMAFGTHYRRDLGQTFNRNTYLRDRRLNNNPYIFSGLETIDDDDENKD